MPDKQAKPENADSLSVGLSDLLYRQNKGQLPFMVCWQSLDGRPRFADYDNFDKAKEQIEHLRSLGRLPALYWRLAV